MEDPEQAIWYVLKTNNHSRGGGSSVGSTQIQGPHSFNQIARWIELESLSEDDLVWREGMELWTPLSETVFLKVFDKEIVVFESSIRTAYPLPTSRLLEIDESEVPWNSSPNDFALSGSLIQRPVKPPPQIQELRPLKEEIQAPADSPKQSKNRRTWTVAAAGAALAVMSGVAFSQLGALERRAVELYPNLDKTDLQKIKQVVNTPVSSGEKFHLILSQDGAGYRLLIASNISSSETLKLSLSGLSETLVGQFEYHVAARLRFENNLGLSPHIRDERHRDPPPGLYRVEIECESCLPKTTHIVPSMFIGGANQAAYEQDLSDFKKLLTDQARVELDELKQIISTLKSQLEETERRYQISSGRSRRWIRFSKEWTALQESLGISLNRQLLNHDQKLYFQQSYQLASTTLKTISQIHVEQDKTRPGRDEQSDLRIQKLVAIAQTGNSTLEEWLADATRALIENKLPAREIKVERF